MSGDGTGDGVGNGAGRPDDAEFDEALSTDPVAMAVRDALHQPTIDTEFRRQLRERLLTEASRRARGREGLPSVLDLRDPFWRRGTARLVWPAAALVAAVLLIFALIPVLRSGSPRLVQVSATSAVAGSVSLSPSTSVLVHFSQPMDHRSVEAALQIEPAVAVHTSWQGDDLLVSADHGLASNTGYLMGFNSSRARTATGARPKTNPYLAFGTAPTAPSATPRAPAALALQIVAAADDGSEAVIAADGSVIGTALQVPGGSSSLAQLVGSRLLPIAPATPAICVSRSGRSLAYLVGSGPGTSIVMANGDGLNGRPLAATVDAGSPLGWIGDDAVSFISGGALKAIDRAGTARTLVAGPIHPETDTVAIAPGGRWVFLGSAGGKAGGRLVDTMTNSIRDLPTASGSPAFSADGATVYWIDGGSTPPRLAVEPSGGGPVLRIPLPVSADDQITDLGVNADGSLLLYTVHHPGGSAQLRLADLPTGSTLAEAGVAGQSPNWSPNADVVAILTPGSESGSGSGGKGSKIALIRVPSSLRVVRSAVEQVANGFARAQVAGDADAMRSLAAVSPTGLPRPSRWSLLVATRRSATTWLVQLRVVADPTAASPIQRAAIETLTVDTSSGRPVIVQASSPPLAPAAAGPHLTGITGGNGDVVLTFDSDLDPATLGRGLVFTGQDGRKIPLTLRYDQTAKAVIAVSTRFTATTKVEVTGSLKDIDGRRAARFDSAVMSAAASGP